MAFCSGPFRLSELGRSGEFTLTSLIIFVFLNVFSTLYKLKFCLYLLFPPGGCSIQPLCDAISFWLVVFGKLLELDFLLLDFSWQLTYFSVFPLNWVVDSCYRYWRRMGGEHRCCFAPILGLFCAMWAYSLQIWVLLSTVPDMCCIFQDIPDCLMRVWSCSLSWWKLKILVV